MSSRRPFVSAVTPPADSPLASWLMGALFLGAVAMLSLPAARGASAAFGWMPLWLLGMPLASLLALWLGRAAAAMRPSVLAAAAPGP
uniref:hypothetical protein n=1 Tax=Luteimonas aquatica TaxID=450364 RepID=UPI001F57E60B